MCLLLLFISMSLVFLDSKNVDLSSGNTTEHDKP